MIESGPHDAITDVPGIEAGHYTDLENATGCTVVLARDGVTPGVFQPGGAPGTLDTDLAVAENSIQEIHAVLLTGGSTVGLDAAAGVRRYLKESGAGLTLMPDLDPLPLAMGAVVFDLVIGNAVHPTGESGYAASTAASSGPLDQGSVGVGAGCTVAKAGSPNTLLKGGLGTASLVHESGLIVGAIVATNSVGDIVDPSTGGLVAGARGSQPGTMSRSTDALLNRTVAEFEEQQQSRPSFSADRAGGQHHARRDRHQRQTAQGHGQTSLDHGSAGFGADDQSRLHPRRRRHHLHPRHRRDRRHQHPRYVDPDRNHGSRGDRHRHPAQRPRGLIPGRNPLGLGVEIVRSTG